MEFRTLKLSKWNLCIWYIVSYSYQTVSTAKKNHLKKEKTKTKAFRILTLFNQSIDWFYLLWCSESLISILPDFALVLWIHRRISSAMKCMGKFTTIGQDTNNPGQDKQVWSIIKMIPTRIESLDIRSLPVFVGTVIVQLDVDSKCWRSCFTTPVLCVKMFAYFILCQLWNV